MIMDTPTKPRIGIGMDSLSNKPEANRQAEEFDEINGKQLDVIATNVNRTIQDLNQIYNDIGYSSTEISLKKAEIFQVLEETICNFTRNLEREKANIDNECEWLRQQIQLILVMINDPHGDINLSDLTKGIVFQNWELYCKGYKEEISNKLMVLQARKDDFYQNSPFNITIGHNSNDVGNNYQQLLETPVVKLSLLQVKGKLNVIFLDVLKVFMKLFKRFNNLNITLIELLELLGIKDSSVEELPGRSDSEYHKELINQFDSTLKCLKLSDKPSAFGLRDTSHDNISFIVSSPRKTNNKPVSDNEELDSSDFKKNEDVMGYLRDLNHKLVRVIRSFKFPQLNNDFLKILSTKIDDYQKEVNKRTEKMNLIIEQCFELISILGYNEEELVNIQKTYITKDNEDGGYFDSETLKFIQMNPKEFGLNDIHIQFIEKFMNLLNKLKQSKTKKWEYYYSNCEKLWSRLDEDSKYIEQFVSANSNLTDNSLNNLKLELNRLFIKRSQFIDKFIINTRQEIADLWTQLYYSENDKNKLIHYEVDSNESFDKEQILTEYELELSKLKLEFDEKKPILEEYSKLNQLLKDQEFLTESSKDSSRLLSKNSCKILLNEERLRKNVLKNMPKLLTSLKQRVTEYNRQGVNFKVNDEDLLTKLKDIEAKQFQKPSPVKKPNNFTKSPNKVINSKKVSIRKPLNRTEKSINPRNRLVNAINNSIGSTNSSPWPRQAEIIKSQSSILKPLFSPLKLSPKTSPKLSPLKLNTFFSPDRLTSPISLSQQSTKDSSIDKENQTLTPIKLEVKLNHNTSTPASENKYSHRRSSIDNSMNDYQQWRNDRIRQLNTMNTNHVK